MAPDAFDILRLPLRFDLSTSELQATYLALSARLHPDASTSATAESQSLSAQLNLARQILENPESRADLLLRRLGGPTKEQDKTLPPGFLAEMLEAREQIQAAIESTDPDRIAEWEDWAATRRKQHIKIVSGLFMGVFDSTVPQNADAQREVLKSVRRELNMWRYMERLLEQLSES